MAKQVRGDELEAFLKGVEQSEFSRRELFRRAALGGAALSLPAFLAACDMGSDQEATPSTEATTTDPGTPKRGGRLRAAITGGANAETLDPHKAVAISDQARSMKLYDRLTEQGPEGDTQMFLAESFEPNSAGDVWTVKLKDGITFHDGKSLTADDVIYSYQRILDPDEALQGASDLSMFDPRGMKKVDDLTVEFRLKSAYADLPTACSQRSLAIIPDGFTDHTKPNGTGPFTHQEFTVGQRSLFGRNASWWQEGKPYVDELEILSIGEPSARVTALRAGQVDAIEGVELAQARSIADDEEIELLDARTGGFNPITISVVAEPFKDVRVRQALRLAVDREQMVEQALLGFGFVGNDLFSPFDPMYADDLPQREQDIEQARSLLRQAGHEDLRITLHSAAVAAGVVESALLFAEQAKAAGITVDVKRSPADSYWNDVYLKVPCAQSLWANRALDPQIRQSVNCDSAYNETEWCVPEFDRLTAEASRTVDEARRGELYHEAQRMLYDEGGNLIWGFKNWVDAYRTNVQGFAPHAANPLGYYGFQEVWLV
jgi:peptide/nickel transport system substrate-binding protein